MKANHHVVVLRKVEWGCGWEEARGRVYSVDPNGEVTVRLVGRSQIQTFSAVPNPGGSTVATDDVILAVSRFAERGRGRG
jgi:zona occludens toxin (predicted ATPase)